MKTPPRLFVVLFFLPGGTNGLGILEAATAENVIAAIKQNITAPLAKVVHAEHLDLCAALQPMLASLDGIEEYCEVNRINHIVVDAENNKFVYIDNDGYQA